MTPPPPPVGPTSRNLPSVVMCVQLQEVANAAKRQLLPDLFLEVDERKLTEDVDQKKGSLKAQITVDDE